MLGGGFLKGLLDTYGDRLRDQVEKLISLDLSTALVVKSFINDKLDLIKS